MFSFLQATVLGRGHPHSGSYRALYQNLRSRLVHGGTGTPLSQRAKRDHWLSPTILVVGSIPVFTFALGTWQLQRLQWKVALINDLEAKLQLDPLPLPERVNLSAISDFVYRRVSIRGRWDHKHSMLLGPRVREGANGFHLVTPLVRTDGSTILVDRGFVSKEYASRSRFSEKEDDGEVEVTGVLRPSETRNRFTPDNHPEKNEWYWADVHAMAEYAGGQQTNVQPVLVDEIFEGHAGDAAMRVSKGIPIGRLSTVDLRNAHMSYVITWYSLSAFTTAMFIRLLLNRRRTVGGRLPR